MTRHGIEHDLKKSPYRVEINYIKTNNYTAVFFFSSLTSRDKFVSSYKPHREEINGSLSRRFKISTIISPAFSDMVLYSKVESRGFYVILDGEVITCLQNLQYDGQKLSKTTFEER